MENEISESAKAIQEVAKTTRVGIEATEKLGGFVSRIINEPVESVIGILTDRLQFIRAERQLRLADRWRDILKERRIEGQLRIAPPKLVLPIIENASLEEDDELQDLWANLLASAVDPNFSGVVRAAYIDIIKQLEVMDVHILKAIYDKYKAHDNAYMDQTGHGVSPNSYAVAKWEITNNLGDVSEKTYENAIDNLIRVRCISSYVEEKTIYLNEYPQLAHVPSYEDVTIHHQYDQLCMTSLGVDFVEACLGVKQ